MVVTMLAMAMIPLIELMIMIRIEDGKNSNDENDSNNMKNER